MTDMQLNLPARMGGAAILCADSALFLDLDGTLLDIASTPQEVTVPEGLVSVLARVHRGLRGALAVLSGRSIRDIDRLLLPLSLPAAGQHGAEIRLGPEAPITCAVPAALPPAWRAELAALAREDQRILIEDKGLSMAVHYRNTTDAEPRVRRELMRLVATDARFVLRPGKCVLEVCPRGADKGTALSRFMSGPPFAGRLPVVLGDDVTDEAAFDAARSIGGDGLRVGPLTAVSAASFPDPQAVRDWLVVCAAALDTAEAPP